MIRQIFFSLALLILSGCASLDKQAQRDGAEGGADVSADTHCPPAKGSVRIRDLTHPWSERAYLRPDGTLCRPQDGG